MDLKAVTGISASALRAQSLRMRVIAENLANADSVAAAPGGAPYRRKLVTMKADGDGVKVGPLATDRSDFQRIYQPGHPAADARGYVMKPNVNSLVESADMKAAQRSHESNLNAIDAARNITLRTIDLIK